MNIRWRRLATPTAPCHCATCGQRFPGKRRVPHLFSDAQLDLGPLCPQCFAASPVQLRERMRRYAYLIHLNRLRHPGSPDHARHLEQLACERSIRYPGPLGWLRHWQKT
ncbi:hypothetical protein [Thermostichus vulcanus]|uniref:Uncharacterized protein n=1 Tax=Thermostichus vulcanus str. 'Rupite' TaxID=2813851 RepID=A0ABT0C6H5_THEVL|nr:hypothetical protein [Thermostichus vulcanus]MCJ2541385.1 hypothetical protein [Thermostichus vulcanus str. 'Rupite']